MLRKCFIDATERLSCCRTFAALSAGSGTALLSFGSGSQGALGTGRDDSEYEPEPVDINEPLWDVGSGHYHSFAISEAGRLWSWGRSREGQLGRGCERDVTVFDSAPGLVEGLQSIKVKQATGSAVASFAVTDDGRLLTWGSSKRGQLGCGSGKQEAQLPTQVAQLQRVVQVSAGWGHALALDEDGGIYSWGFPAHGRLGHSYSKDQFEEAEEAVLSRCVWEPQRVEALSGIKICQVACGMDFSLALACDGRVFAFGDNSLGQLGRREEARRMSHHAEDWTVLGADGEPILCEKVAAGLGHCLAVGKSGELLSWGWNSAGQLGLGQSKKAEVVFVPSVVDGVPLHPKAHVAAGRVHSLLATDDPVSDDTAARDEPTTAGYVRQQCSLVQTYTWGSGIQGRLGLGSQNDATYPELIAELDGSEIQAAACGFDHSLVLLQL